MMARWIDLVVIGWAAVLALELVDGTVGAVLAMIVLVGFEAGCTLRWGRTPGKAVAGLALATPQGEPLPPRAALLRPVVLLVTFAVPWAYWVPVWAAVLVAWITVVPQGRLLHDRACGSSVIIAR